MGSSRLLSSCIYPVSSHFLPHEAMPGPLVNWWARLGLDDWIVVGHDRKAFWCHQKALRIPKGRECYQSKGLSGEWWTQVVPTPLRPLRPADPRAKHCPTKNLTHLSISLTPSHQTWSHLCANVIFSHFHPLSAGAEEVQLKKKKKTHACVCAQKINIITGTDWLINSFLESDDYSYGGKTMLMN